MPSFPWGGKQQTLPASGLWLKEPVQHVGLISGGERCVELHTQAVLAVGRSPLRLSLTGLLDRGTIRRFEGVSRAVSWPP